MEYWSIEKKNMENPTETNIVLIITPSLHHSNIPFLTHLHSILNDSTIFILAARRDGMRPAPIEVTMTTSQDCIKLQIGMEN